MDVLQETVRYIVDLERRLLAQVQCAGLPPQLQKFDDPASAPSSSTPAASVQMQDLRSLLHTSLGPVLEARLTKQRAEDETNIARLLEEANAATTSKTDT